ncbi:pyruvate, water dikinase [Natronincola peptidivorans]|uniref:Pyruvate, water dikinase n=1 Tax=Natronincola peptidivorans TaxID=426128 RepID=A0A1I0HGC1_9FIRM|nr:PEP/pyruvate-binding domain-containing protein [Natronincola peptidivorans]SET82804.1 pyruvate, water dikinase [Natronincola peptidivorans]
MRDVKYTELLQNVTKRDFSKVGGKAANLGEMIEAGLPVPEGFVLLVDAYNSFLVANKLNSRIKELLQTFDYQQYDKLERTSEKIQQLFEEGEIPKDVLIAIDKAYEEMGNPEVAVRSSATVEDLPGTSFAGQYDTYLNVKGKDRLYQSIKKCWASLWNPRALSYRSKQKLNSTDLAHAVVIQRLINAEKSGILFTANPINSRRDQMQLNSSWGLGDAIVGGNVVPDQWILDKNRQQIVEESIATKETMTVRKQAGVELVAVPEEKRQKATLSKEEVFQILKLGKKAEKHFGSPQDIEWVFYKNKFYLVQSRPITSLFPMLKPEGTGEGLRVYMNFLMSNQAMNEPLTPIGQDIWEKVIMNIVLKQNNREKSVSWLKHGAGRLFIDVTEFSRLERWWDKLRNNPSDMEPLTTKAVLHVLERDKEQLVKEKMSLFKLIPIKTVFKLNPAFGKFILTSFPKATYGAVFPPEKVVAKAFAYGNRQIAAMEESRKELKTIEEKLAFIENNIVTFFYFAPLKILYYVVISFSYFDKAKDIFTRHFRDTSQLNKVKKAVPHNVTTEMGMELLEIAKNLDDANEKPDPHHPQVKQFLHRYGHRSCQEVDLGVPRWREEPEYIITLIQSYIDNKSYHTGIEKFYRDRQQAEEAINNITKQLKDKGAHGDAKRVNKLLKNYRKMFGIRELPKYILTKAVSIFREILLEIGEELQSEGRLDDKQDIFFVTLQDIKSEKKLQKLVKQNRREYQQELQRNLVPRVITSTGETIYFPAEDESANGFSGIPVSPGIYEGHVRVLSHPQEGNRLKQGEILVTKTTNPAWTPLFLKAGGLIMEIGGPLSHGSVVAREYGLPAVVGVTEVATKLEDGQKIRLNGETGRIDIVQ